MKQLLNAPSIFLYFLAIIAFFFVGVSYAGWVEAGKNQGLAGGAIVIGYGVVAAFIALISALFIAYYIKRPVIVKINVVLAISILAFWGYYTWNYYTNVKPKREKSALEVNKYKQNTSPVTANTAESPPAELEESQPIEPVKALDIANEQTEVAGLGMFAPNIFEQRILHFYGNPNFDKALNEHTPTDSVTFLRTENGFDIATAPPWLVPAHMKLDYGILFFKVVSIAQDFLEVEVNATNRQTGFISRKAGRFTYWQDFLLGVNSVELLDPARQEVFVKPLDHAGKVLTKYDFMKPIRVNHNWMYVKLLNDGYKEVGKGWVKWQKDGKLLIRYKLLS